MQLYERISLQADIILLNERDIKMKEYLYELKGKCIEKIAKTADRVKDGIPCFTTGGMYNDYSDEENIRCWTNSFYAGILWKMYDQTGDERYLEYAVGIEKKLEKVLYNFETLDHDVGFIWLLSGVEHYQHSGDKRAKNDSLLAASVLASRYNMGSGVIRAWDNGLGAGAAIIDCMMNLPLLYWASDITGDNRFKKVAQAHADKAAKHFVRADGSVKHIVLFDTETGIEIANYGGQGYKVGSAWSRGQSWALYGFALSYKLSEKKEYLEQSIKTAEYFINEAQKNNWKIKCDFRQPEECELYDSSAAAIAANGLIELYKLTDHKDYLDAAVQLIKCCDENFCPWNSKDEALLAYACEAYSVGVQKGLIYGDYYFFDAVCKLYEIYK